MVDRALLTWRRIFMADPMIDPGLLEEVQL
jgi:hypothetical protein